MMLLALIMQQIRTDRRSPRAQRPLGRPVGSSVGLVVQPADPCDVRIDRDDGEQCKEVLQVLAFRVFGGTSDTGV